MLFGMLFVVVALFFGHCLFELLEIVMKHFFCLRGSLYDFQETVTDAKSVV